MIGLVTFALLSAAGAAALALDGPLRWIGRAVQTVRNALRRQVPPVARLPERLLGERDRLLNTLGPRWKGALLAAMGRWAWTTRRFWRPWPPSDPPPSGPCSVRLLHS